ncbi:MAG: transcriptional regulator [Eubacteriales bacterium]|nr:transcriptional regulator [Eubacteriales bacterium]
MDNNKTKADILKGEILSQYKSVRQFATKLGIPYSTLVTALDRGIEGMAYETVIRICEELSLNPVDFSRLEDGNDLSQQLATKRVMTAYNKLNKAGKKKIMDFMEDYGRIDLYTIREESAEN